MKTAWIWLAAGAVVALGAFRAYAVSQLTAYISKVGVQFDGINPVILLDLGVQNPTSRGYSVSAISGSVYFNGSQVGTVSFFESVNIERLSEKKIVLPVRMSLLGAGATLVEAVTRGVKGVKLEFVGTINLNSIPAPLRLNYNVI